MPNRAVDEKQSTDLYFGENNNIIKTVRGGTSPGTFACRELVIAYAAWISAAFHLKVIRTFLAANETLSPAQRGEIFNLVAEKFKDGKTRHMAWRKFNNHFGIARYADLPPAKMEEAKLFIGGLECNPRPPSNVVTPRPLRYALIAQMAKDESRKSNYEQAINALDLLERATKNEVVLGRLKLIRACLDRCAYEADEVAVLLTSAVARFNSWTGTGILG